MQGLMTYFKEFEAHPEKLLVKQWHDLFLFHKDHFACSENNGSRGPNKRHKEQLVLKKLVVKIHVSIFIFIFQI